ncbi:hypothetical protein ACPZ19_46280 [Amycolatopsis lurida]
MAVFLPSTSIPCLSCGAESGAERTTSRTNTTCGELLSNSKKLVDLVDVALDAMPRQIYAVGPGWSPVL